MELNVFVHFQGYRGDLNLLAKKTWKTLITQANRNNYGNNLIPRLSVMKSG